jgi:hypothetical protein
MSISGTLWEARGGGSGDELSSSRKSSWRLQDDGKRLTGKVLVMRGWRCWVTTTVEPIRRKVVPYRLPSQPSNLMSLSLSIFHHFRHRLSRLTWSPRTYFRAHHLPVPCSMIIIFLGSPSLLWANLNSGKSPPCAVGLTLRGMGVSLGVDDEDEDEFELMGRKLSG